MRKSVISMEKKIRVGIYNKATTMEKGIIAWEKCKEYVKNNKNMEIVKCYGDFYPRKVKIQNRMGLKHLLKESEELQLDLIVIASMKNATRKTEEFIWLDKNFKKLNLDSFFVEEKVSGKELFPKMKILDAVKILDEEPENQMMLN